MEEEYRMQKAQSDVKRTSLHTNGVQPTETDVSQMVIYEDGTVGRTSMEDDSSTRAIVSPVPKDDPHDSSLHASNIPTIRISTESDRDLDEEEKDVAGADERKQNGIHHGAALEKPVQAAAGEADDADGDNPTTTEPFSFSNKRLCERWLDNLFMVLYEVCCLYSVPVLWTHEQTQGSESMDHFQGRGGTLQNPTPCVP